jgi:hypothetical protein
MMGFTSEGQADPAMIKQRNDRMGVDTTTIKAQRSDIRIPTPDPKANGWQYGKVIQISDPTGQNIHSHPDAPTAPKQNSRSSQ